MGIQFSVNACAIVLSGKKPGLYALDRADSELIIDAKHLLAVALTVL